MIPLHARLPLGEVISTVEKTAREMRAEAGDPFFYRGSHRPGLIVAAGEKIAVCEGCHTWPCVHWDEEMGPRP